MQSLQKRVCITGASSGIGKEFAYQLAGKGYRVTGVSSNSQKLKEVMQNLPGGNHSTLVIDLATQKGIELLAHHIHDNKYDLLINNAGVGLFGSFADTPYNEFEAMMRLNINALTQLSHVFLQTATRGDALINVSSMVSYTSYPKSPLYAGTKGFVRLFSESLFYTEGKKGIYVMTLCPGITKTDWHMRAGGAKEQSYPPFIAQSAVACVKEAMSALEIRRDAVVIPNWVNRFVVFLSNFVSRNTTINLQGRHISDQIK